MDVLVTGRRMQMPDEFKEFVTDKLHSVEKFRDRLERAEVQFTQEQGPGDLIACEVTLIGKGPVVRARATHEDKHGAFELAMDKLKGQLRKAADRRKHHRGLRSADLGDWTVELPTPAVEDVNQPRTVAGDVQVTGDGPLAVREKVFDATPLTLAQALDEMELVGHDFFLYIDAETDAPSVVYRRKGYDYGVIHLKRS